MAGLGVELLRASISDPINISEGEPMRDIQTKQHDFCSKSIKQIEGEYNKQLKLSRKEYQQELDRLTERLHSRTYRLRSIYYTWGFPRLHNLVAFLVSKLSRFMISKGTFWLCANCRKPWILIAHKASKEYIYESIICLDCEHQSIKRFKRY